MYLQLAEDNLYLSKGSIFKKAFKGIKKVGLSVPRNAYLALLDFNVHGWASKMKKAIGINPGKVQSKWESLGGNFNKLKKAAERGAKKKHLADGCGNDYTLCEDGQMLGIAPAAAAAAAAPIIAALAPLLKAILPEKDAPEVDQAVQAAAAAGGDVQTDPTDPQHKDKFDTEKEGLLGSIPKPVLYGGIALIAFIILRKKR